MRLTLLTHDITRDDDPLDIINSLDNWGWTNLSTTPAAGGASPFFYWAPVNTKVLPDFWTDFEIDEFAWLHKRTPIFLELTDSDYQQVIARIESRQVFHPSNEPFRSGTPKSR